MSGTTRKYGSGPAPDIHYDCGCLDVIDCFSGMVRRVKRCEDAMARFKRSKDTKFPLLDGSLRYVQQPKGLERMAFTRFRVMLLQPNERPPWSTDGKVRTCSSSPRWDDYCTVLGWPEPPDAALPLEVVPWRASSQGGPAF